MLLDRFRGEQEPGVRRKLVGGDLRRKAQGEVELARADRFAKRLLRELDLAGACIRQGREQFGGARMLPVDGRGARLDVSQRRIAGRQPRERRIGSKEDRREGGTGEQLTCSGNWGLRRLRE